MSDFIKTNIKYPKSDNIISPIGNLLDFNNVIPDKKLIIKARENNLKIYGCTILPFGNFGDYTEEKNSIREEVNYWIWNTSASQGGFDKIIDFEKLTADKNNNTLLAAPFDCSDGLHPSANGYKQMATAFNDLTIFL